MDFESDFMGPVGGLGAALDAFDAAGREATEAEGSAWDDSKLPRALDLTVGEGVR